ncbi:lactonase family protein [Pedobacter deserti]|uniref:lactonase family protein n=1 Tax=Pedobacter deserti TaxID=2817382 RepID=UPI00210ABF42|nr:lactonase family protein [Pedobacter sp. SYSU D00382]
MKTGLVLIAIIITTMQGYSQKKGFTLLTGTYTNTGKSEGIYIFEFDPATGDAVQRGVAKGVDNPSYLNLSRDNRFVYAVNETGETSAASAFSYNRSLQQLRFLNKLSTDGADPCYVISDGRHVITANYTGGSISVFDIAADGSLGKLKQRIQHEGSSANQERQESSHVHMVQFTPDGKYVVVNDLGTDKVYLYQYNPVDTGLVLTAHQSLSITPGAGPRHLVFNAAGDYAYLVHELDGGITVLSYANGILKPLQEVNMNGDNFLGENGGADIHLSPDGRFLYASNRGSENKIAIFAVGEDGRLTKRKLVSTMGKGPRNFTLDPTGKYLLVANQQSDMVVVFERDAKSGDLKDTGKRIAVGAPSCLLFTGD